MSTFTKLARLSEIIIVAAACVVMGRGQDAAAGGMDRQVDKILTRLEDRTVKDLRAKVTWTAVSDFGSTTNVKEGEIWYKDMQPVPKFKVHFTGGVLDGRKQKLNEQHMFDGRWYVEAREAPTKMIVRREVRRENEVGNPYKLGEGEGMFPLPFGQKKSAILKEFEIKIVPGAKDDPADTDHLMLIPRPGTRTDERYTRLDFWVKQSGRQAGLPVKVRTTKKDGTGESSDTTTVDFRDAELDAGFSNNVFEIPKEAGWEEQVDKLSPESAAAPGAKRPTP